MNTLPPDSASPDSSGLSQMTDRSLLRRFRDGNEDAATAIYLRYAERLQRLANGQVSPQLATRIDPEDIVQSVFRTFFRRAADGQYDVSDSESLWKLLLVMSLNKIRSSGTFHNAARRNVSKTMPLDCEVDTSSANPDSQTAFRVLKLTIEEIVGQLPEEQHEIIFLRIQGFEIDEIAERSGRAKRSIERILQGFRKKLLKELGDPT